MKKSIESVLKNFNAKNVISVSAMNKLTGGVAASTPDTCSGNKEDDCEADPYPIVPIKPKPVDTSSL